MEKIKDLYPWQEEKLKSVSKGRKLPKGYVALSKKIAKLEEKKKKIYDQISDLRIKVRIEDCTHPMKYLELKGSYSTDTLGNNGRTTYYVHCKMCELFERVDRE